MIPRRVLARLRTEPGGQHLAHRADDCGGERDLYKLSECRALLRHTEGLFPVASLCPKARASITAGSRFSCRRAECGPEARRILEARGYRLHAISGRSWEFKAGEMPRPSLKNLYKATPHRCAELHIEPASAERPLLARTERQRLHDVWFPVLPAEDLFMGQGLHLFKHLCSESSRAAHMLEFRRHVMARSRDAGFWARLRPVAEADPRAPLALGVATLWITHLMGDFAPAAFTEWTVDRVPDSVRLWIEVYARRITLANSSGTKLYLMLRQELTRAGACRRAGGPDGRWYLAGCRHQLRCRWPTNRWCRECGDIGGNFATF